MEGETIIHTHFWPPCHQDVCPVGWIKSLYPTSWRTPQSHKGFVTSKKSLCLLILCGPQSCLLFVSVTDQQVMSRYRPPPPSDQVVISWSGSELSWGGGHWPVTILILCLLFQEGGGGEPNLLLFVHILSKERFCQLGLLVPRIIVKFNDHVQILYFPYSKLVQKYSVQT